MVITFIFIISYLLNSFAWMSFIFNTEKKIYISLTIILKYFTTLIHLFF